ncbi:LysM peptidoglycan-binding domain-containing protein [Kineobactrum salinum]|uniref:LysM peptidoglycan-binding domain-containing protein n=1 Tax=Kineobactrum salinum TaxID=2708301 RepID=UPI001E4053BF|nr:LysM peptidoglycan-binding domain-containing protein [Kineobactrum salinum]
MARSSRRDSPTEPSALRPEDHEDLWSRIRAGLSWEAPDDGMVEEALAQYLAQPAYLDVIGERGALYLYHIVQEVEQRQMPLELALLPLVESTLNPYARSPQHALGLWQIMPATGKHLGISSDWWYDGRRDIRESTAAALDYLQSLHDTLEGDWMLAIAAYNGGIGRVTRAIARNEAAGRRTDFWSLPLPPETRAYVPRLIALSNLVADPEAWDLALPPLANAPAFVAVTTTGQVELARAAELAGMELARLQALNPGHLRWATAPEVSELLVPPERASTLRRRLASLDPDELVQWQRYRVRAGDTLGHIARKFGVEVGALQQANKLRGSLIRAGADLMIPRGGSPGRTLALAGAVEPQAYRVRRGDSLYRIANQFKVSIEDIISWNALNPRAYLQPGQRLTLYVGGQ